MKGAAMKGAGMNSVETYLKRATRGLYGAKRQEAQAELRGAVEDKIYRYTLLGLNPHDAQAAALRDLGDPRAIARELSEIHTLPPVLKYTLLTGLTALLSFQAAAKTYVINVSPASTEQLRYEVCNMSAERLSKLDGAYRDYVEAQIKRYGSRARAEAECVKEQPNPARFMRVSDLKNAFRAAGFKVYEDNLLSGRIAVDFKGNGNWTTLTPSEGVRMTSGKESYVDGGFFLTELRRQSPLPIKLQGARNPTLEIGPMKVQLGTQAKPLDTASFLSSVVSQDFTALLNRDPASSAAPFRSVAWSVGVAFKDWPINIPGPDGTLYATLRTDARCHCSRDEEGSLYLVMSLQSVEKGVIYGPPPTAPGTPPRMNSTRALFQARAKGQAAYLVYKVDTSDLRNIKFTLVPQVWK